MRSNGYREQVLWPDEKQGESARAFCSQFESPSKAIEGGVLSVLAGSFIRLVDDYVQWVGWEDEQIRACSPSKLRRPGAVTPRDCQLPQMPRKVFLRITDLFGCLYDILLSCYRPMMSAVSR
jgi:hypothetical protein